jgi:heme exporter protein B
MSRILTLVKKDLLLEWRQKHSFYGILLYMASTVFVLYLSLPESPEPNVWNALFWLIQLFIGINAIAKSFLQEGKGRMLYFYTVASASEFILSKLVYNTLLMIILSVISLGFLIFFLSNPLSDLAIFTGVTVLGGIGISLVFTLMSAITAKAQQNAALMAILGFPVIIPQLLLLMRLSRAAFAEVFQQGAFLQLAGLTLMLDILVVALGLILFPYLWKD